MILFSVQKIKVRKSIYFLYCIKNKPQIVIKSIIIIKKTNQI